MNPTDLTVVEKIGSGTFGVVYKCIDINNNVRCVKQIKLVNTSHGTSNAHYEQIQQEIYLLQNLVHPRIISLHQYFFSKDYKYIHIVMEHATYGALSTLITQKYKENRNFDEVIIKHYLIDMVLGIEYLHMKNVIHKDLKPCNILICQNERLKIADFGVSKITAIDNCNLNQLFTQNGTTEAGGSPIYMAPETLIYKHFSCASDIWALGCILYELCTLQTAFGFVESMDELIRCTLTKAYIPFDSNNQPYSNEMFALCNNMMTVDIEQRATINNIISNPLLTTDYYHNYFQFDV